MVKNQFGRALAFAIAAILVSGVMSVATTASAATPSADRRTASPSTESAADGRVVSPRKTARLSRCWRRHRRCYASIYFNYKTWRSYKANERGTARGAKRAARRKCRRHARPGACSYRGWVRNGCIANAYRTRRGYVREMSTGWDVKGNKNWRTARRHARRKLGRAGTRRNGWAVCTTHVDR